MQFYQSFDNLSIAYNFIQGSQKKALFCLHGWSADAFTLQFLHQYLPHLNLFLWDARCHGKSQIDVDANVQKMAKDFHFFIEKVYPFDYPITLLGHSMGALTLWEYLKTYQSPKIEKIIIIDQSPKLLTDSTWDLGIYGNYPSSLNQEMIADFKKDLGAGVIRLSTSGLYTEYNNIFKAHPEFFYKRKKNYSIEQTQGLISIWESLCQADYRPVLPTINLPTLLLYGEKSQYYKKETAFFVKNQIKNSVLHFFQKGDHSPFLEHPQEFCSAIDDFLKS